MVITMNIPGSFVCWKLLNGRITVATSNCPYQWGVSLKKTPKTETPITKNTHFDSILS